MFAVLITALLCLVSVAHSDDAPCDNLVRPLDQVDPDKFQGNWALIAGSMQNYGAQEALKGSSSVTVFFQGTTYTMSNRIEGDCSYFQQNFTIENNLMKYWQRNISFTGTFYKTSCQDCFLMAMAINSGHKTSVEFYLFSKNRPVEDRVLEEFKSQAECLKLLAPIKLDPTKELCPEQAASNPDPETA